MISFRVQLIMAGILWSSLCASVPGNEAKDSLLSGATVHALIIGVSDYGDGAAAAFKARTGAERFAKAVESTYGKTCLHTLFDEAATLKAVKNELEKIKRVAPGSLVIIYFSGHGHRQDFKNLAFPSELHLRLHGSTATDFLGDSIIADELWKCLLPTQLTNGMIFLDCCYAGQEARNVFIPEAVLNHVDVRAFMMGSSSSKEVTTGDVFTTSLIEVWQEAETRKKSHPHDCMSLQDFAERVKEKVDDKNRQFMTANLWFETKIARCITHMTEPAALISLTFPRGCNVKLNIEFNGGVVKRGFIYGQKDRVFVSQVSRERPVRVSLRGPGGDLVVPEVTIDPSDYAQPIVEIPVEVPETFASLAAASVNSATAESLGEVALRMEAFGLDPSSVLWQAAIAQHKADPDSDNSWMLRKASVHNPQNSLLHVAANGVSDMHMDALVASVAQSATAGQQMLQSLEQVGRFGVSGTLAERLAEIDAYTEDDKLWFAIRAFGDKKIAGIDQDEGTMTAIAKEVAKSNRVLHANTWYSILRNDPSKLRSEWSILPKSVFEYGSWSHWKGSSDPKDGLIHGISNDEKDSIINAVITNRPGYAVWEWDGRRCVAPSWMPFDAKNCEDHPWISEIKYRDRKISYTACDAATGLRYSVAKPGFQVFLDSENVWIRKGKKFLYGASELHHPPATLGGAYTFTLDGQGLTKGKLHATDKDTVLEYILTVPGYVTEVNGNVVDIKPLATYPIASNGATIERTLETVAGKIVMRTKSKSGLQPFLDGIVDRWAIVNW